MPTMAARPCGEFCTSQHASIQGKLPETDGASRHASTRTKLANMRMRSTSLTILGCNRTKFGPTMQQNNKVWRQTASSACSLVEPPMQSLNWPGGDATLANKVAKVNKQSTPPEADAVKVNRPSKLSTTLPACKGWQHSDKWFANM